MAKPKIALIPAAIGTKLYSVLPSNGSGDFDFTRGSAATRINAQGLIESVANTSSRLNYPLLEGKVVGCPHNLLEPQRSNLITYSEDFSQWQLIGTPTVNLNNIISPNGLLKGTKVTIGSNTTPLRFFTSSIVGVEHTFSIYAKKGSFDKIGLDIGDQTELNFTLTDEWQRFQVTSTASGTNNFVDISLPNSISGDNIYVWGAQLEAGSYSTSYIPTSGSEVTRLAETATGSGNSTTFNDSEGVLMAEIISIANTGVSGSVYLGDGGLSNRLQIVLHSGGTILGFSTGTNGGTSQVLESNVKNYDSFHRVSLTYSSTNTALWIDGFKQNSVNGNFSFNDGELSTLRFSIGSEFIYGKAKQLQYFDSALTDTQLEQLTSWQSFSDMAEGQLYTIE